MMIKNIDLKAGTFELNGQIIKIPAGIDIFDYIDSEVETIEAIDVDIDAEEDAAKDIEERHCISLELTPYYLFKVA